MQREPGAKRLHSTPLDVEGSRLANTHPNHLDHDITRTSLLASPERHH